MVERERVEERLFSLFGWLETMRLKEMGNAQAKCLR